MAGGVQYFGGRRSGGRRKNAKLMSDINVTPMVDVMLVLLIIFMVTAPLLTVGVPVDLPKTEAKNITEPEEPVVVSVNSAGAVFLQDTEIKLEDLVQRLQAVTENKPDTRVFVRGDKAINYGRVMEVMGTINAAGFSHVALVAEMATSAASRASSPGSSKRGRQ